MADAARARRMAGRIKQIVATGIEMQVKDPRLGMVTITDVRVTGDLHDATLFYTVFGTQDERTASAMALEAAKGVLRSEDGGQRGRGVCRHLVAPDCPDIRQRARRIVGAHGGCG